MTGYVASTILGLTLSLYLRDVCIKVAEMRHGQRRERAARAMLTASLIISLPGVFLVILLGVKLFLILIL